MAAVRFEPSRVRRARAAAGLSQRQVAAAAGVSIDTVRRTETGSHEPGASVLGRIAAAVGADPGDFFIHEDEPAMATNGHGRISAEVPAQRTPAAAQPSGEEIRATTGAHSGG